MLDLKMKKKMMMMNIMMIIVMEIIDMLKQIEKIDL